VQKELLWKVSHSSFFALNSLYVVNAKMHHIEVKLMLVFLALAKLNVRE
jgi:hypothetical protein